MRFYAEKNRIEGSGRGEVADNFRAYFKVGFGTAVSRMNDPKSALLHGLQVGSAGKQRHVLASACHTSADVTTNSSRAGNQAAQDQAPVSAWATAPLWILPVAVRGMAVVM